MVTQQSVSILQNPEYHRYFVWTGTSLKLVGTPPEEVVRAWDALRFGQPVHSDKGRAAQG